jgi:glycosyltransferase involved in cell wall biosynthesis
VSKKILFIAPYPEGKAPSQRFRFEQYFGEFKKAGYDIELRSFLSEKDWAPLYKKGSTLRKAFSMLRSFWKRFILLFSLGKYDSIFIHREASMIGPPVFEWIIAKILRKDFIYDFDDAIWLPNYSQSNAKFQKLKAYGKVKRIIKWAKHVTVGNDFLKEYALQFNKNITVIPTTIDNVNVHNKNTDHEREVPIIGWTGTHTTMEYLHMLLPVLNDLKKEHNFKFRVISNHPPELDFEYLEYVQWNKETEIKDLSEINIGVMPLEDSIWTKGKCGFKGLQYMSLQIPAVMSNVGVNSTIIQHKKNGFLCNSLDDWKETLSSLLKDVELRRKIGIEGQRTVNEKYSTQANKDKYLALFQ